MEPNCTGSSDGGEIPQQRTHQKYIGVKTAQEPRTEKKFHSQDTPKYLGAKLDRKLGRRRNSIHSKDTPKYLGVKLDRKLGRRRNSTARTHQSTLESNCTGNSDGEEIPQPGHTKVPWSQTAQEIQTEKKFHSKDTLIKVPWSQTAQETRTEEKFHRKDTLIKYLGVKLHRKFRRRINSTARTHQLKYLGVKLDRKLTRGGPFISDMGNKAIRKMAIVKKKLAGSKCGANKQNPDPDIRRLRPASHGICLLCLDHSCQKATHQSGPKSRTLAYASSQVA